MGLFKQAVKHEAKLRLAITGPSGSGKTFTALAIAEGMGGPVAVVDTEHGSASKYADLFKFDVLEMQPPFHPDRFIEAIQAAAGAGYKVIVLDSLTHAWKGTGGLLQIVDQIGKRSNSNNSYTAWKDATPIQERLVESIVGAGLHVIATMRSKQEYALEKDEKTGKTAPKKIGMAAEQRDGFEYEFDIVLDMNMAHEAVVSKTRCTALTDAILPKPGKEVAGVLMEWLQGAPAEQQKPVAAAPAQNGNTPAPVAEPEPEPRQVIMTPTLKRLNIVGSEMYGEEWDAKRPLIVAAITSRHTPDKQPRTRSSKELFEDEARELIDGLIKRLADRAAVQAEPEPPLEPEPVMQSKAVLPF